MSLYWLQPCSVPQSKDEGMKARLEPGEWVMGKGRGGYLSIQAGHHRLICVYIHYELCWISSPAHNISALNTSRELLG